MVNVQHLTGTYGWHLLAVVTAVAIAIAFWRYGRMLERQTRERSERL